MNLKFEMVCETRCLIGVAYYLVIVQCVAHVDYPIEKAPQFVGEP